VAVGGSPAGGPHVGAGYPRVRLVIPEIRYSAANRESDVRAGQPPTAARVDRWIRLAPTVQGRPEWKFVKIHTHGAAERQADVLLGPPLERMYEYLTSRYTTVLSICCTTCQRGRSTTSSRRGKRGKPAIPGRIATTSWHRRRSSRRVQGPPREWGQAHRIRPCAPPHRVPLEHVAADPLSHVRRWTAPGAYAGSARIARPDGRTSCPFFWSENPPKRIPGSCRRSSRAGHTLGNHSFSQHKAQDHELGDREIGHCRNGRAPGEIRRQVETPVPSALGRSAPAAVSALVLGIDDLVRWSRDSMDYKHGAEAVIENFRRRPPESGDIILSMTITRLRRKRWKY